MPCTEKTDANRKIRNTFAHAAVLTALLSLAGPLFADITITQLANEGVMVTDGQTRVLIDGMVVEPYSIYGGLPPDGVASFEQVEGAFASIDLALVSHRHHDHNQPRFACRFMQGSTGTELHSSGQVLGLMREKCREFVIQSPRVHEIDPQYGAPVDIREGSARVTVFPLSHGTRKYARIQNYGHLLELGGMAVLHIGDAAMDGTDFARAGLEHAEIDVALIPYWYFQPGPGESVFRQYMDAPHKIAVHIPPGEMQEIEAHIRQAFPEVLILQPLDEARFTASDPPPR